MKLTVFQPLNDDGTYGPSWSWNARNSGKIVTSAHGYNSTSIAVTAVLNHAGQWYKLMHFGDKMPAALRDRVRARVSIVRRK
jgi:hypothetical protein